MTAIHTASATTATATIEPHDAGSPTPHIRIAIVGSGFAGMGLAIKLRQEGRDDFLVFERGEDVGGTWRDNTYPGCQCDVPSNLYSFSFAPNPDWTHTYATQPEIRTYLQECADRFGIRPHIRFGHRVIDARWNDTDTRWHIDTSEGSFTADLVVVGAGPFSDPSIPEIPGAASFTGTSFHTARWDHDHELTGERIAVIGTGASAIQAVPAIQPIVEHLTLFQRTPPWVLPHPGRDVPESKRRRYRRFPITQKIDRAFTYVVRELSVIAFTKRPEFMEAPEREGIKHMERAVADPELRAKLRPTFSLGCKRVLLSDKWYPAIAQPNVDVVTESIREITPEGVVTADGVEYPVDTIIWATGFHVTDIPAAQHVWNAKGENLLHEITDGDGMYLGTTAPGFPNLFVMVGPNTGLGHSSIVYMIESQLNYILDAIHQIDDRGLATVTVRGGPARDYNAEMQRGLEGTIWNSGCASWYLDANGRNQTLWPTFTWKFRARTRRFDIANYDFVTQRERQLIASQRSSGTGTTRDTAAFIGG